MPKQMKQVDGYDQLSSEQQIVLESTYQSHLEAMGAQVRIRYGLERIREVRWNSREQCVGIFFVNGDWWHYLNNTWW